MDGTFIMHGEVIIAYKTLARKTKGIRPLGRSRCRWENIKLQYSMNLQVLYTAENFLTR
jgi:hypothetical protein